jgi:Cd2+/Zn2+-exporting ATPase
MNNLFLEAKKIPNPRDSRRIKEKLGKLDGINKVSTSISGVIQITHDREIIDESIILKKLRRWGIQIIKVHNQSHKEGDQNSTLPPFYLRFLGENTELIFAVISGILWTVGVVLSFVLKDEAQIIRLMYVLACLFGGYFTFITAGRDLLARKFEIDFLMLFAAIGAAFLGKWGEGALLLFLFSLGHALEHYAMKRARKSISALSDLSPPTALLKIGVETKEVPIELLNLGDIIVVRPNSKIAADGVVIKGNSSVNQAPITGESVPVDKNPDKYWKKGSDINRLSAEHRVFAGTINGSGVLEIKVLKKAEDSTLSRLITLVKEAETQKSPTQQLTDRFEKYYVPGILILVLFLLLAFLVLDETFQESFYRAMSVLIAASPCALAISTPSAVLAGIARAARHGVLIKGGRPLEDLGDVQAIAFDKTGTLTQGQPILTDAIPFGKVGRNQLLETAMAVEELSDHPLAAAIVKGAQKELKNENIPKATGLEALTARGIRANFRGDIIHIGNRRLMEEVTGQPVPKNIQKNMDSLETSGHTVMIVLSDRQYLGIIGVMDIARKEAKETLVRLKKMGIRKTVMLTGDHQKVADAIAQEIGISNPLGSLLPEQKVEAIKKLKIEVGKVAMVGDGVNDAPAMAMSTVGIAMGAAGSDIALETADIALMADKLDNLPFAIGLSRKAKRIIAQNLVISLGMVAILVPLTMLGMIAIGPAVVGHEGSTILVVMNALRLLRYDVY